MLRRARGPRAARLHRHASTNGNGLPSGRSQVYKWFPCIGHPFLSGAANSFCANPIRYRDFSYERCNRLRRRTTGSRQLSRQTSYRRGHRPRFYSLTLGFMLSRQGHRLLQTGVALFLLTSFEGFVIPSFAAPRLGLSAHSLMALLGVLFVAMGLLWPKLHLGSTASRLAFWLLIYSSLAIVAAYLLGAILGAGNFTMPLAAGTAHGSGLQEAVIKIVAYSSAPTGIVSFGLIFWGLRIRNTQSRNG
jgi:(hydroxyamino)benzene mutase